MSKFCYGYPQIPLENYARLRKLTCLNSQKIKRNLEKIPDKDV